LKSLGVSNERGVVQAAPANLTVEPGQSISYHVQVSPDYGAYAGTVSFAVAGLPSGATVAFSPSTIGSNGGPQAITVTITTAPATAMNRERTGTDRRNGYGRQFAAHIHRHPQCAVATCRARERTSRAAAGEKQCNES
jgi:hypothetical protein